LVAETRFQRVQRLFELVTDLPEEQRRAVLERESQGDPSLLREVESLLQADSHGGGFLDQPALGKGFDAEAAAFRSRATPGPSTRLPERIGGYAIHRRLGSGTFADVYLARRDLDGREVALKVLRPGMDAKALRYFELESKVLARLRHVGVARVFEAGTAETPFGMQPFFAMEYIEGLPLTRYAEQNSLGLKQRLKLVVKICAAVEHAHQKGIVHRDLKPGNILVDALGQPKVLDFGVARLTDSDIQTATVRTEPGQPMGTVPYMSPEQASGDPQEVDTRSDVYALGVILFELLANRLPYNLIDRPIHEALRIIREEEPIRLGTLQKAFRGDVDTIVRKALEKDKNRRYQSAAALAGDIERCLRDEPILARPPTTWYEISKFYRRNQVLVLSVAFVFFSLLAALAIVGSIALDLARKVDALESRLRLQELNTHREQGGPARSSDLPSPAPSRPEPGEDGR
jgi:serine/threonine protein kinase